MTLLETDQSVERYLGAVEKSIVLSDATAQKRLDDDAAKALTHIEKAQEHLNEDTRKEIDLLRAAIDELRVQYALGKMEGTEKLAEIEERIGHGYQNLKNSVHRAKKLTEHEAEEFNQILHSGWRNLKLEINLLRLRLELARDVSGEKLVAAKEDLVEDAKFLAKLGKEEAELIENNLSAWCNKLEKSLRKSALNLLHSMEKYLLNSK